MLNVRQCNVTVENENIFAEKFCCQIQCMLMTHCVITILYNVFISF